MRRPCGATLPMECRAPTETFASGIRSGGLDQRVSPSDVGKLCPPRSMSAACSAAAAFGRGDATTATANPCAACEPGAPRGRGRTASPEVATLRAAEHALGGPRPGRSPETPRLSSATRTLVCRPESSRACCPRGRASTDRCPGLRQAGDPPSFQPHEPGSCVLRRDFRSTTPLHHVS